MMSYKLQGILAGTLTALLIVDLGVLGRAGSAPEQMIFAYSPGEMITEMEIERPGRDTVLIRAEGQTVPPNISINSYRFVKPHTKNADFNAVRDVLHYLYRLERTDAIELKGRKHSEFGLDQPSLIVRIKKTHSPRNIEILFGKPEPAAKEGYDFVYCMLGGDDRFVYHFFKGHYDLLAQEIDGWRTRQVVDFQPALVERIRIDFRPVAKESPQMTEVTLERFREWWITEPFRVKAELGDVERLMQILTDLRADRFDPILKPEDLAKNKLDQWWLKMQLFIKGSRRPLEITFSEVEETVTADHKHFHSHVFIGGADEAAWADASKLDVELPKSHDQLRPKTVFAVPEQELRKVEIYCADLGRLELVQDYEEREDPRPGHPRMRVPVWKITNPPNLMESEGPERDAQQRYSHEFVKFLTSTAIIRFDGRWPHSPETRALFEKPTCRLSFTYASPTGPEEKKVFYFKSEKETGFCYVPVDENRYERMVVEYPLIVQLRQMEWNVVVRPVVSLDPTQLTEVEVLQRGTDGSERKYRIVSVPGTDNSQVQWRSTLQSEYLKFSEDNFRVWLEKLRRLMATHIMKKVGGNEPDLLSPWGLDRAAILIRFKFKTGNTPLERTLRISAASDPGESYFAKDEQEPVVFQIPNEVVHLVENLHVRR